MDHENHKIHILERSNYGTFRGISYRWECACGLVGQWGVSRSTVEEDSEEHLKSVTTSKSS